MNIFEREIQEIGQKLLHTLKLIKYRLKYLKSKNQVQHSLNSALYVAMMIYDQIYYCDSLIDKFDFIINVIFHKARIHFRYTRKRKLSMQFLNMMIAVSILLMFVYSIKKFKKSDIYGKNVIAYRYKGLLMNTENNRLLDIMSKVIT